MKIFGKTVNFSEASNVVQCNSLELFTSEQSYLHMPLLHGMQRQQQTSQIRLVVGLQASLYMLCNSLNIKYVRKRFVCAYEAMLNEQLRSLISFIADENKF